MKPIQIRRMKDKNEKFYTDKGELFNLPMKLLIIGRSQLSGKSNFLGNLLLSDDPRLYGDDFEGENIYLFTPSVTDHKLKVIIRNKEIPKSNIFTEMNDDIIDALYENIQEEYEELVEDGERPPNVLFIFDDMSFGGSTKTKAMEKLFCNGRHLNISTIVTAQKYTQIGTCARENSTGIVMFNSTDKQLELMSEDNNYFENKKDFRKLFRTLTEKPHSFMVVNYSNPSEKMYMNNHFQPVGKCGKPKNGECKCP